MERARETEELAESQVENAIPEGEEIAGGEITGGIQPEDVRNEIKRRRERTSSALSWTLVIIMAVTVIGHYATTAAFLRAGDSASVEVLKGIYDGWLPVISGFVGAAVTYYLTHDRE